MDIGGMFLVKRRSFGLNWANALFSTYGQAKEWIDDRAYPEEWHIEIIDKVEITQDLSNDS